MTHSRVNTSNCDCGACPKKKRAAREIRKVITIKHETNGFLPLPDNYYFATAKGGKLPNTGGSRRPSLFSVTHLGKAQVDINQL